MGPEVPALVLHARVEKSVQSESNVGAGKDAVPGKTFSPPEVDRIRNCPAS